MAELGETRDPQALVPGNAASIANTAQSLRDYGDTLHKTGAGLKSINTADSWSGEAAETFRDVFPQQPTHWFEAGDCFHDAAKALTTYGSTLQWAQQQAADAIRLWDEGNAATRQAATQHTEQLQQVQQQLASAPTAPADVPFVDPGQAKREAAQGILDRARNQVSTAGDTAADTVARARDQAPQKPGFWSRVGQSAEEAGADVVNDVTSFGNAMTTHPADVAQTAAGLGLAAAGAGGEAGGALLDATGVGAAGGIPAAIASAGLITAGAGMAGSSLRDLTLHATSDDQVSPMQVNSNAAGGSSEPPFPPPKEITGTTEHAEEQIAGRDGHGVNDQAVQDAVDHPTKPPQYRPDRYGGAYRYVGRNATVNLNKDGKIVTAWARNQAGWRNP
jgi:uncharacterized protein YukE